MKVLIDENLPPALYRELPGHAAASVQHMGWRSVKNGSLLRLAAAGGFDVLLTWDADMEAEQNPATLPMTVVVLDVPNNALEDVRPVLPRVLVLLGNPPLPKAFIHVHP